MSVDALLAQVYAAPDDLELRAVVGDALQQLGDPRGELIALQLAKRPNARLIGALIDEHRVHLAGALSRVVPTGGRFEFEAGFLEAVTLGSEWTTAREREEAAVSPHWATVTSVDFTGLRAQSKWFELWWSTAKVDRLRRIKIGGFGLDRESAAVPWQFRFSMRPAPPADVRLAELVRRIVQPT